MIERKGASCLVVATVMATGLLSLGSTAEGAVWLCCNPATGACRFPEDNHCMNCTGIELCGQGNCTTDTTLCCWSYQGCNHCGTIARGCCEAFGGSDVSSCSLFQCPQNCRPTEDPELEDYVAEPVTWSEADGDAECDSNVDLTEEEWNALLTQLIGARR